MFGIGAPELILIFLIVLLVFGAKRLPEIARSLGKATQEFRKAKNEFSAIATEATNEDDAAQASPKAPPRAESGKPPAKGSA